MEIIWENVGEGNVHWIDTEEKFTQVRLSLAYDGTFLKQFVGVFAKMGAAHWIRENNCTVVGRNNR
jgi:hypothetical protein